MIHATIITVPENAIRSCQKRFLYINIRLSLLSSLDHCTYEVLHKKAYFIVISTLEDIGVWVSRHHVVTSTRGLATQREVGNSAVVLFIAINICVYVRVTGRDEEIIW
jgi:hypothetical protein